MRSASRRPALGTAALPVTGNATFSLWDDADAMKRFAYGAPNGHRGVIATDTRCGILLEQITVRFEPIAIRGTWDPLTTANSDALGAFADRLRTNGASALCV